MRTSIIGAAVLGAAVIWVEGASAGVGVSTKPIGVTPPPCASVAATTTMSLPPTVEDSWCDGSCGGLANIGLGGPVASGTPVGSGKLTYVDQWRGGCRVSGGALDGKCHADTVCKPGWQRFADGGVWKCKQTVTVVVPNPEFLACWAKADGLEASGSKHLTADQRASTTRASYAKVTVLTRGGAEVKTKWVIHVGSFPSGTNLAEVVLDGIGAVALEAKAQLTAATAAAKQSEIKSSEAANRAKETYKKAAQDGKITKAEQAEVDAANRDAQIAKDQAEKDKQTRDGLAAYRTSFEQNLGSFVRDRVQDIVAKFKP